MNFIVVVIIIMLIIIIVCFWSIIVFSCYFVPETVFWGDSRPEYLFWCLDPCRWA